MEVVEVLVLLFRTPREKEIRIGARRGFNIESQNKMQIKRQLFSSVNLEKKVENRKSNQIKFRMRKAGLEVMFKMRYVYVLSI